ncbi:MAG: class II aldolase/adducin family protein [Candidatus Lokiarchaeota archaeon]|nr:class II aldolase/adducin family protein [Candidatus Lokiarchaeota archaeon]
MIIDDSIYEIFRKIGKHLVRHGYNTSHSGNISIRSGGKIFIKRRSAMLGDLLLEDLVECSLTEEDSSSLIASTELGVHRAIYLNTDAMAVIHAHNPYCVALSLIEDEITCVDAEGFALYKKIPIIDVKIPAGAYYTSIEVPKVLKNYPFVIVRGHGIFAKGMTLEDALQYVTGAEQSAKIRYLTLLTGKPLLRDLSQEGDFSDW